jgi:hypothetical protein
MSKLNQALADYEQFVSAAQLGATPTKLVTLGDKALFRLFIGDRVLKDDLPQGDGKIPVYSANVFSPMGLLEKSNVTDFNVPAILWGIDGNFEFNLIPAGTEFATTDHCGTIQILDAFIVPEYLLYALTFSRVEESFDRSFRASLANMRRFAIAMPILNNGTFDVAAQQSIASRFTGRREKRENLESIKSELDSLFARYVF